MTYLEVTITYLEMTSPPTQPVGEFPSQAKIRRVINPPVHFYRYLYNTVGERWLWYERRLYADSVLAAEVQHPDVHIYLLSVQGAPAGFAELDYRPADGVELAYFGLIPEFIGLRLGGVFLRWVIAQAWQSNPQRISVNTCTLDHPNALPNYLRMGFNPLRTETKFIVDPRERGIIPPITDS